MKTSYLVLAALGIAILVVLLLGFLFGIVVLASFVRTLGWVLTFGLIGWGLVIYYFRNQVPGDPFAIALSRDTSWRYRPDIDDEIDVMIDGFEERNLLVLSHGEDGVSRRRDSSLNRGIAINKQLVDEDEAYAYPGDSWLCDHRPFYFMALQLLPAWLFSSALTTLVSLIWWWWQVADKEANPFSPGDLASGLVFMCSVASFVAWTWHLVWESYVVVQANFRLGVKRFGEQLEGFLCPGLHFILPWGWEVGESVSLKLAHWGTHGEEPLASQFVIGGSLGTENPGPGLFTIYLFGAWPFETSVGVTLAVYQSDKAAWDAYLNKYGDLDEIGQEIARQIQAVLTNKAREVEWENFPLAEDRERASEDPRAAAMIIRMLLDRMPEAAGECMQAIHRLGRDDCGGFLIRRVIISAVTPDATYRSLMQETNQAEVQRYIQQQLGMAAAERWEEFDRFLNRIEDPAKRANFQRMAQQEIDRMLYEGVSKDGGLIEAVIAKLTTQINSQT